MNSNHFEQQQRYQQKHEMDRNHFGPFDQSENEIVELSQQSCLTSMLPDDVVVYIGKIVAKLCGIQSFVYLSWTSKRLKRLLIDSEDVVSDIIRIRTTLIDRASASLVLSPSSPWSSPIVIKTLEQQAFYEIAMENNLFEENRINFDFASLEIDERERDSSLLIETIRTVLEKFPSTRVILDGHCGTQAPVEIASLFSQFRGTVVYEAIVDGRSVHGKAINANDRITVRAWGTLVAEKACQSKHPYSKLAKQGRGWVEVSLYIMGHDGEIVLELPPRPDFYKGITVPQQYTAAQAQWLLNHDWITAEEDDEDSSVEGSFNGVVD